MIKYETFAYGSSTKSIEKGRDTLLDQVQKFINEKGEKNILAVTGFMNAIVVWYKE